jgi:prevent-host-death family protein
MKKVALSEIKDQLSKYLREAQRGDVLITLHGKAAGILIGFESEDDWFDYRLENDPRFLGRVERARNSLRAGRGVRLEDVPRARPDQPNKRMQPARARVRAPSARRRARGRSAR